MTKFSDCVNISISKNIFGDITDIYYGSTPVASYKYDAWGNCTVCNLDGSENTDRNFIGNIIIGDFMREDILGVAILMIFFVLITWFFLLIGLLSVKRTKRVVERHPYFTYPWYKRLFYLGLNKHRYLTVFAFMVHINHFLYYISLIIDYFISKKITIISKIGTLLEIVNMGIMAIYLHIVDHYKKKGWKFNK